MLKPLSSLYNRIKPKWLVFRPTCLLCLDVVQEGSLNICADCKKDLPWIIQGCSCCNLPLQHEGVCGQCLKEQPYYDKVVAPWRYEFPIAQLITRFKHHQQWPLGHLLAALLTEQLEQQYNHGLAKPDCLIPVPISKERFKQRGFNQAEMLAQWLHKSLSLNINNHALTRIINTPSQQKLSAMQRRNNLKNAFQINDKTNLQNLHIAIVDDVVTTGTTVNILSKLLKQLGVRRIDIYCIARTPHLFN